MNKCIKSCIVIAILFFAPFCYGSNHFMENDVVQNNINHLNWLDIGNNIEKNINISSLLPYAVDKIYVGTSSGVFAYNKGSEIIKNEEVCSGRGLEKEKILTLQIHGKALYAGTLNGIFKIEVDDTNNIIFNTSAGNYVWKHIWLSNNNYDNVLVLYSHKDYLYAGTKDGKVYKHKVGDDDNNWINIGVLENKNVHVLCEFDGYLYAGTDGGGVYKLQIENVKDKKNTWQDTELTKLTTKNILALTKNDNAIYAGTYGDGVFRLNKNENAWSDLFLSGLSNKYIFSLSVIETYLYAGTDNGVYRIDFSRDPSKNMDLLHLKEGKYPDKWRVVPSTSKRSTLLVKSISGDQLFVENDGLRIFTINHKQVILDKDNTLMAETMNGNNSNVFAYDDMATNRFRKLFQDDDHILYQYKDRLYAVSKQGVFSTKDKEIWNKEENLNGVYVKSFCTHEGNLYIGTDQGVYKKGNVDWKEINDMLPLGDNGIYVYGLCSYSGNLYAGTRQSVYKLGAKNQWEKEEKTYLKNNSIKSLYSVGDYMYLITGQNELMQVVKDAAGKLVIDTSENHVVKFPVGVQIKCLYLYDQDYLYIGTSTGIFRIKIGSNVLENYGLGVEKKSITSLCSYNGSLYAGTKNEGIFKKELGSAQWYNIGLGYERITTMIAYDNQLCVGTESGRILGGDNAVMTSWYKDQMFGNKSALDVHAYGDYLYVITTDGKVLRKSNDNNNDKWNEVAKGLHENYQASTLCTYDGSLYIGTTGNWVYRLQNSVDGIWDVVGNKLKKQNILSLAAYKGYLYAGTNLGINKLDKDEKTQWNMLQNDQLPEQQMNNLFVTKENLYAVDGSNDIYVMKGGDKWSKLVNLGYAPKSLYEYQNNIYIGTNDAGIFNLNLKNNNSVWENNLKYRTVTSFYSQGQSLFAGVADGRVYVTQDNGSHWAQVARLGEDCILKFYADNDDLYAVTKNGFYQNQMP